MIDDSSNRRMYRSSTSSLILRTRKFNCCNNYAFLALIWTYFCNRIWFKNAREKEIIYNDEGVTVSKEVDTKYNIDFVCLNINIVRLNYSYGKVLTRFSQNIVLDR